MNPALFKSILLILLLKVLMPKPSLSQVESTESAIRQMMQQREAVGLSVAVVKDNKLVYSQSFGLKDIAANEPLTNESIFRIASISKSFSATSIMQLVKAKKLSLDADVGDLIGFKVRNPRYPDKIITLRMIMSHRSSINDSQGYFTLDVINPGKNTDWPKSYNDYEPGTGYMYCNLNYNLVGTIIERVSGERFDQYVRHHVLEPLELYGGYCVDSLDQTRFATIYEYDDSLKTFVASPGAYNPRREELAQYVSGYSTPIFSPTGGMKISATDLAKYMMMHMNYGKYQGKRIIPKKRSKEMQTDLSEKEGYGLALGTFKKLIDGEEMKGHTGSAYGLFSGMFFNPKAKFGFVVITNGCKPGYIDGLNAVIKEAVNILYDRFIKRKL